MSLRKLLQILQEVEMDIAITDPVEKRVVKTWPLGPDKNLPLSDFPCVMNFPEAAPNMDGRFGQDQNALTYVVRVLVVYGYAGRSENTDVALALFDATRRLFDRERQADWRLGTDEGHLLDMAIDGSPLSDIAWTVPENSKETGYSGTQLLLTFQVFDRDPLP